MSRRRSWALLLSATLSLTAMACGDDAPPLPPEAGVTDALLLVRAPLEGEAPPPCKMTVEGRGETSDPAWGAGGVGEWIAPEAFRIANTVVTLRCDLSLRLPAGTYALTISRGPEHELATAEVELAAGEERDLIVEMPRAVDSSGWACADFHVHSAPSFDSEVPLDQRLVSAVSEGLDAIAPSDHDALGDWETAQMTAGVEDALLVLVGDELTPDQWSVPTFVGHVGLFPVPAGFDPMSLVLPGSDLDGLVTAARAAAPAAVLQINHPRWNEYIGQFVVFELDRAAAFDAIEVWNGHELDARADGSTTDQVLADWWDLLAAGAPLVATGNSDTHRLEVTPVGYPRTCVRVPDDSGPSTFADTLLDGLRAGDAFVTSGVFLELAVGDVGLGGIADATSGVVRARAHVQAPTWIDVQRVLWVLDGEIVHTSALDSAPPVTIEHELRVDADGTLLVLAEGDVPLGIATGQRQEPLRSLAFTNPIYLDADGDGL